MSAHEQLKAWLDGDASDLEAAIVADIQQHVATLQASGDSFYGYAVLPGDYCTQPNPASIAIAFNRESDISPEHSTEPYYRYSVDVWQNYVHDGFDASNAAMEAQFTKFKELHTPDEGSYQLDQFEIAFVAKINRTILAALMALKQNGTFADETYLIIWLSDSDAEIMNESAAALNNSRICEQYASEFQ